MKDKDLLEYAASAIGLKHDEEINELPSGMPAFWIDHPQTHWWNPLSDDGDALRLATSLGMTINTKFISVSCPGNGSSLHGYNPSDVSGEKGEALRRAIVVVAASIGRSTYGEKLKPSLDWVP